MACLARYFRQEVLDSVKADVDIVIAISAGPVEDDAPPDPKRARRAEAAPEDVSAAVTYHQLVRFPAHTIILDTSDYFKVQQVRVLTSTQSAAGRQQWFEYSCMCCRYT
jgi:uncharacterized protein (DUF849 family)